MRMLNLGCGSVFHASWHNIDIVSGHPDVQPHDITKRLPYSDGFFDACYSSHVLEHLDREKVSDVLDECLRVLRPGGILRIVVPDLEGIVKNYLSALDRADGGDQAAAENYDWMMLELCDQMVRTNSQGRMAAFLRSTNPESRRFISSRIGLEAENIWSAAGTDRESKFLRIIAKRNPARIMRHVRFVIAKMAVYMIAGRRGVQAFSEGWFRNSGEVHRWMYDRFSIRRLLTQAGFVNVVVCQADQSRIPDFNRYELDIVRGDVRKPDSLFIEALKPNT